MNHSEELIKIPSKRDDRASARRPKIHVKLQDDHERIVLRATKQPIASAQSPATEPTPSGKRQEDRKVAGKRKAERKMPLGLGTAYLLTKGIPRFFSKRYTLLSEKGEGGQASVYQAKDKLLNIKVAVKVLPVSLGLDVAAVERFKNEAKLAMALSHENIVRLYHFDIERGRIFLVMEYVEGKNFRQILDEITALSMNSVLEVAKSCASALDYAHERGVIHRDLKPENLMISKDSVLKIVDFGTARRIGNPPLKTENAYVEGTPNYAAPEQFTGNSFDPRSDIYSLGTIFYELLTGKPVFPFGSSVETIIETPPSPMPGDIPRAIGDVINKAISKDINDRWPSAGVFYEKLREAVKEGKSPGMLP